MVAEANGPIPKPFDAAAHLVNLRGKDYLEVKWRLVWLRSEHPDAVIDTEMVRFDPPMAIFKAKVSIPGGGSATGWGQEEAADFGDYLEKAETKAVGRALGALGYGTQFTEDWDVSPGQERPTGAGQRQHQSAPQSGTPQQGGKSVVLSRDEYLAQKKAREAQSTEAAEPAQQPPAAPKAAPQAVAIPPAEPRATADPRQAGADRAPKTKPPALVTEAQVKAIYAIGRGVREWQNDWIDEACKEKYGGRLPTELTQREASAYIDYLKGEPTT